MQTAPNGYFVVSKILHFHVKNAHPSDSYVRDSTWRIRGAFDRDWGINAGGVGVL